MAKKKKSVRACTTTMSLTELPQFGRLVEFVMWAREYGENSCDGPLLDELDELSDDLREMNRKLASDTFGRLGD